MTPDSIDFPLDSPSSSFAAAQSEPSASPGIPCPACGSPVTEPDPSPYFSRYCRACGHRTPLSIDTKGHEDVV